MRGSLSIVPLSPHLVRHLAAACAVTSVVGALGCGAGPSTVDTKGGPPLPPSPPACASEPTLAEARGQLAAWPAASPLGERTLQTVALASAPFGLASPGDDHAALFADAATYAAKRELSAVPLPFDESKEKLVVVQSWPREATYAFVRDGATAVVRVERALPCLAPEELGSFRSGYPTFLFVAVPRDVTAVRVETREGTYRYTPPVAKSGCERDDDAIIGGGGQPNAYDADGAIGLAFGGFSAMTGNVFTATSNDGAVFSPGGWSEERRMRFEERGPYAGIHSPFVERRNEGYRLTATSEAQDRIVDGRIERRGPSVVEAASKDGVAFGPDRVLLDDATVRSPSRVDMADGSSWLYVVGTDGAVHVARETNGKYVLAPTPVFAIDPNARPDASLGVFDAEVRRVGEELWMVYSAGTGGLSATRPHRAGIGLAKSRDGLAWVDGGGWLVAQERASEAGGFGSATFAVRGDRMHLYFTMVNAASEPAIGHARCPLR